ncbi:TIMELESS-interacting protein [Phoenix dactylifera]|uniref:TIMELESS-interacting protein n=1 Tax=Phoenix dactylifera TaxID=42345 RepID=A0A8B7CT02_PHODC|nr:TIMELESS-interacting protein [Phoenix dactylifera]
MQTTGAAGGGAATGCFKCGRPGHWSRDCPSSFSATNPNPNPNPGTPFSSSSKFPQQPASGKATAAASSAAKKAPRTRPKVTPDLLLSEDGLGYVLRHFPRSFKYHGRGHEVSDLGNLINMYAEWHARLIPYYSFDQFVHKVEQVGATKRVRRCIAELRDRVAKGGDPTKLHEPPVEQVPLECEVENTAMEDQIADTIDPPLENHDADDMQEDMFNEIYEKAAEEPHHPSQQEPSQGSQGIAASEVDPELRSLEEPPNQAAVNTVTVPSKIQITEEQRARMEANRLKALERAAARARVSQAP